MGKITELIDLEKPTDSSSNGEIFDPQFDIEKWSSIAVIISAIVSVISIYLKLQQL